MLPLSETVAAFTPFLAPALVGPPALERVLRASGGLPAALSDRLCLECRLGSLDSRTDLIVGVKEQGRAILAGATRLPPGPASGAEGGWEPVRALCRQWSDPASPLHREMSCLWLELDLPDAAAAASPPPGVFLDFARGAAAASTSFDLPRRGLGSLLGAPLPSHLLRGILRCYRLLPPGARIPYVGVLLPRGTEAVRLCVMGLADDRLPGFLAEAGWPGPPAVLRELLGSLRAHRAAPGRSTVSVLNLDVGEGVQPRIGLELAFDRADQLHGRLREASLLDLLVERGWCSPPVREALLRWPGHAVERLPHTLWPSVAMRHLAHVKLVLSGGTMEEAKAYLSLRNAPRVRAAGRPGTLPNRAFLPPDSPPRLAAIP